MSDVLTPAAMREQFMQARQKGLRAKEAAESIGQTEGAALAAFVGASVPSLATLPVQSALAVYPLKTQWLEILRSLELCGPLMALTRNESTVHERTGVYTKVSGSETMGLVLGKDIDLRLFLGRWAAGLLVVEPGAAADAHVKTSLQFFDERGVAMHKIFPVQATDRDAWHSVLESWVDLEQSIEFDPSLEPLVRRGEHVQNPAALSADWAAMTDTHQFFGLLKKHDVDRIPAFEVVEGRFTRRVTPASVRFALYQAAFSGLPIMIFVGSPGCIQIHTGPVTRIEPMEMHGKQWLNVLDPGFNLHMREDLIGQCWVVEKPTEDGIVSSLEVFDHKGELMLMMFGERKPGAPELQAWKDLLTEIPTLGVATAQAQSDLNPSGWNRIGQLG